jgi:L-alanine-DL-glutamate epimerase-like enolase superfamily enzyme
MKITAIETVRSAWYPRPVWVLIRTDQGITGLGETTGGPGAVEDAIHHDLADLLLGADPMDVEGLHALLMRQNRVWRTRDAGTRAVSALDVALWDVVAQAKGVPIWAALGGKSRDSVPLYNTCASAAYAVRPGEGAAKLSTPASPSLARSFRSPLTGEGQGESSSPQPPGGRDTQRPLRAAQSHAAGSHSNLDPRPDPFLSSGRENTDDLQWFLSDAGGLAQSLLDDGFSGMKIWPFDQFASESGGQLISGEQVVAGIDAFRRVRDATGARMEVAAELHAMWSLPAALRIVDALNEFDLMWVEDPVGAQDVEALAQVARASRNPIAASESLATREAFEGLFDRGGVRICMLDVCWVGGLTEARAIAGMAASARVPLTPHDCTGPVNLMAGLHLSVHAPNAVIQETVRSFNREVYPRVVDRLPVFRDGNAIAPAAPGLGMALRPDFLADPQTRVRRTAGQ